MGKFSFTVLAAAAELERSMIRERVILGMQDAQLRLKAGKLTRKGKSRWAGRPKLSADTRQAIRDLRHSGLSFRKIAAKVKVSRMSVIRYLRRKRA